MVRIMLAQYKLQIIFIGLALLALTIFGMVAYDRSLEIRMQQELSILGNFSEYLAKDLSRHSSTDGELQAYLNHENFLPKDYLLIIKKDNKIFTPYRNKNIIQELYYQRLFSMKNHNGYYDFSKNIFAWNRVNIKHYHAILLHKFPNDNFNTFFLSLGLPLIITGLIIMWLVFWAARIHNSLINKLKEKNKSMQHMVLHDALTNLPNRFLLQDRIEQTIKISTNSRSSFALIIIDLKRFKDINDSLGHHFGDALLIAISDSLQDNLHHSDIAARIGGNEFAVLVSGINEYTLSEAIDDLKNIFYRDYDLGDHKLYSDASMGVAFFPEHGTNAATLTQRAEMAMNIAKQTGSNYEVYSPENDKTNVERLKLSSDLRDAITNKEFELYYQPQFNYSDNKCTHLEALIRWHHPKNGITQPTQFIPLAESIGLISNISQWVMQSAIQQCGQWRKQGHEFNVAINLSAGDILETTLPSRIQLLLDTNQVPNESLIVEVTETVMTTNVKRASEILQQLHDSGIKIALDDFGTGFSSLNHLRHFPIDEVKIDRSFVSTMLTNSDDLALVKAIIDLSHDLNICVVAEGVETLQEAATLNDFSCDRLQGYHYSKPIPVDQVLTCLSEIQVLKQSSNA